jgi:hypothetical protein
MTSENESSSSASPDIAVYIKLQDNSFLVYDDTMSFIELIEDKKTLTKVVSKIIKDRLNGTDSSLW